MAAVYDIPPAPSVHFHHENRGVDIWTERLHLRSVTMEDYADYVRLFGDEESIKMYADGKTRDADSVSERLQGWVNRWQQGDPFSALRVEMNDGTFIGHVIMGYGDSEAQSEFAILLLKEFWNKGYGTEATSAVVNELAQEILKRNIPVNRNAKNIPTAPLQVIKATSREDNWPSNKIMQKLGFELDDRNFKWGNWRNVYRLQLK